MRVRVRWIGWDCWLFGWQVRPTHIAVDFGPFALCFMR